VSPAQTMALFLRTWRAEWASLSRAQLALALSAQCECQNGKRIAPAVVRKWERGQPPETGEELAALTLVMRRHGLQASEVEQFRQTVFGACVARQYPGLLEQEDLPYRRDLTDIAQAFFARHWEVPGSTDIVQLTVGVGRLEQATRGELGPASSPDQLRQQRLALCHLRALLVDAHSYGGRLETSAATLASNADGLEAWFGPAGLGWPLTPLKQRADEAYLRSRLALPPAAARPHLPSAGWALRLVTLSEEAAARGEERTSRQAFFYALHALREHKHPAYETYRARASEAITGAEDAGDADSAQHGHLQVVRASAKQGRLDEAERHLAGIVQWADAAPPYQVIWHECLSHVAYARGDINEAQAELERGLAVAWEAKGLAHWEAAFLRALQTCERRPKAAAQARAR